MRDDAEQLWLQENLNRVAIKQVKSEMDRRGKALPCHVVAIVGQIVTVAFDVEDTPGPLPQITIPKAEGPWIIAPTQIGDVGMTVPADAYLDGISGMGPGIASLRRMSNLSALVWVPVAQVYTVPPVQNAATVQGPQGAIIRTTEGPTPSSVVTNLFGTTVTFGSSVLTVEEGKISMTAGGKTVTLNGAGFTIDGILFDTHVHPGVITGPEVTGGPI